MDTGRLLEITFTLVLVYLVLSNASNFKTAIESIGGVYVKGVTALQARN